MLSTINLTQARKDLYKIAAEVQNGNPILVTNRNGNNIVIISEDDFLAMQETIYLCSIPGLVETVLASKDKPMEVMEVFNPDEEW